MLINLRTPAVLVALLLAAAPAWAQDERVGIRVREWYAALEGTVQSEKGVLNGTNVDLGSDLGLDEEAFTTELQAYVRFPFFGRIYAGWWRLDREGDEVLSRTINFADRSFTASTQVKSGLDLDVFYLSYEYSLPTIPLGELFKLEWGILVGARGFRGEASMENALVEGSDDFAAGLPVLGGRVALQMTKWLRAEVELMGLTVSYGDNEVSYLEAFAELVVQPFPWLYAGVGYKFAALDLELDSGSEELRLDIDISGFYLTAGVKF